MDESVQLRIRIPGHLHAFGITDAIATAACAMK
jgi:hypothetical protein